MPARTKFSLPSRLTPRSKPATLPPKQSWNINDELKEPQQSRGEPFDVYPETHVRPQQTSEEPFIIPQETQGKWPDTPPKMDETPSDIPKQPKFNHFDYVELPNTVVRRSRSFVLVEDDDVSRFMPRWEVIKYQIHEMKRVIRAGEHVGDAIKTCILGYNSELTCSFGVLYDMIEVATDLFGDEEVREVVEFIGDACLEIDGMTNGVKMLKGLKFGGVERVELGKLDVLILLACGFMCTYPGRDGKCQAYSSYPRINFDGLFDDKYRNSWGWGIWVCCKHSKVHRLLCIFNYFRRMYERMCSGQLDNKSKVSYERRTLSFDDTPEWGGWMRQKFCELDIHEHGVLEESSGCMQIDFANKFVGGSTLGHGIRMEEIMFSQSPELIVTQLFTKVLSDNECVVVDGAERFSITEGYGTSFRYVGEWFDERGSRVGVMDAVKFEKNSLGVQLERAWMDRELTKCFVTMKGEMFVASGKWGAGVFNGDALLKCVLQWVSASVAGVKGLELYTFGDRELNKQLIRISKFIRQRGCSVGEIYELLVRFGESLGGRNVSTSELFEYLCSNVGTDVKEFGVDSAQEHDVGTPTKWYVVELVYRLAMAWKGVSGVIAAGMVLGWAGQQWVAYGRNLLND